MDGRPRSAIFVPEDDRWKFGCCGRLGARDMREDETERACCEVRGACGSLILEMELERFTEAGCGIAEL